VKEMGGFNKCIQQVHSQLRKWIAQQVSRIEESDENVDADFLLSSANLLRQRGEANRRKALKMVKRCHRILEEQDDPEKLRRCRIQEAHILFELDDLDGSYRVAEKVMSKLLYPLKNNTEDNCCKKDFLELFHLMGVIQNGLEQPRNALRTLKKAQVLARSWFGNDSDEYLVAKWNLGTLLLEQKNFRAALEIIETQHVRQINCNEENELISTKLKLAACLNGLGVYDRAFKLAAESVDILESYNLMRNEILVEAKCTLQDIKDAQAKPDSFGSLGDIENSESDLINIEEEEQEMKDPLHDIDSYMDLEIYDLPPLNKVNTLPASMMITISDYVAEQEVRTGGLQRGITLNTNYQNVQLEFSWRFLKSLKRLADTEKKEESEDIKTIEEIYIFRKYADIIINCYLVSNLHQLKFLNRYSPNMLTSDEELLSILNALHRESRETLEKKRLDLRRNGLRRNDSSKIPSAELDTLIRFCEKQFETMISDNNWENAKRINPEERGHIVKGLRQNFMYTIKDNAQIKAELESQIKEKEWMKRNWMETLVDICKYLYDLEDNVANNYIGKTILQFAYPFLPIPYWETMKTTEFNEDDQVVVLPEMNRQNPKRMPVKIGKIIENGKTRSLVELFAENKVDQETVSVSNEDLARLFTWKCWRCVNRNTTQNETALWRDVYPEKKWIECLRCGLVALKVGGNQRYTKRHKVRRSAFGFIFFGYDWKFGRDVAIKECSIKHMEQKIRVDTNVFVAEDVINEIRLHSRVSNPIKGISHPGIISIYETFKADGKLNIVLEWADQGDLFDYVQKHFQNPENRSNRKVIREWQEEIQIKFYIMCSATKFMHDKGIVHRDISLENILMITNEDNESGLPSILPRICDFGLATEYEGNERFRDSVGKSGYWSMECEKGYYDGRKNDVWCLGVALFLMLFGGPPYPQIYGRAFQMIFKKKTLLKLIHLYELPHLLPEGALETLSRIFKVEKDRFGITDVLNTPWMRQAAEILKNRGVSPSSNLF